MLQRIEYNRTAAVEYAERWALSRNPKFYSFENIGGDCTNFASQCVYAGCGVMNYTPVYGWYFINVNSRSPSWTGVQYFYNFMTQNNSVGPYAKAGDLSLAQPGDIIQLGNEKGIFYHSLVVLAVTDDDIYIAANSNDALFRPLSSYRYAYARCIHILGAMVWVE